MAVAAHGRGQTGGGGGGGGVHTPPCITVGVQTIKSTQLEETDIFVRIGWERCAEISFYLEDEISARALLNGVT